MAGQAVRCAAGRLAYLNFERDPDLAACFAGNDPAATLAILEARLRQRIVPGRCLLFLDEVQAAAAVLGKLRWFAEELPTLAVVAAGSLLDFALAEPSFAMPVGRVTFGHLEPMTFAEFLLACGDERLLAAARAATPAEPVPPPLHERLLAQLAEQFVGQELRACRPFNLEPALFTWVRQARSSNAEVDYVLQLGADIVPIAVKAAPPGHCAVCT